MVEHKLEKPFYRLEKVCFNCTFFRRKKVNKFSRFGLCTIIKYHNPNIKSMPKEEQRLHFDKTSIDSSCDWHQFTGGAFVKKAGMSCGAYPNV